MPKMKFITLAAAALLAGALAQPANAASSNAHPKHPATAAKASAKVDATKAALRDLWINHIFWVRNVAVAELANDNAAQQVAEKQVVANAQSIAGAIEPFYGAQAKEKLFNLLAGHWGAIKAYLDATKANDSAKQSDATNKLMANATDIATFLSGANPNWPKQTVEELLQAHAGHHIAQIQQLAAKDYAGEAKTWADMSQHMYVIADALADGLAKQFPAQF